MQAVFSAFFYFAPIALYQGMLIVGYATLYTMAPVFSLVLDQDVSEDIALLYPELYKDLTKVSALRSGCRIQHSGHSINLCTLRARDDRYHIELFSPGSSSAFIKVLCMLCTV